VAGAAVGAAVGLGPQAVSTNMAITSIASTLDIIFFILTSPLLE